MNLNTPRHLKRSGWSRAGLNLLLICILLAPLFVPSAAVQAQSGSVGYRDFTFPANTGVDEAATGEKPESKLWWADGSWYGSLWSQGANAYTIQRFNPGSQNWTDTGVKIDDRLNSKADALWDGSKLFVVSHPFVENGAAAAPAGSRGELYRYSYNPGAKTFALDGGFPVEVNAATTETLVVDKDSAGQLWVTYVQSGKVMVNHSNGANHQQWGTPFALPASGSENVTTDDISSLIAYNGYIGVMWSRQTAPRTMYFAVHPDGTSDATWTVLRSYTVSGDDHINLKSLQSDSAGNLFAVIKTENNPTLIVLLVCRTNSSRCQSEADWTPHIVYDSVEYNPTRPMMVIDESNRHVYVFTRNEPSGSGAGGIYYKRANLDNIAFDAGALGTPFINNTTDDEVNDPTGSKHNVSAATGLLILASDPVTRYYLHNYMPLGGGPPPQNYTLTTSVQGSGQVLRDPALSSYQAGSVVTLTAQPAPGWHFIGWQGDLTGSANPANLTINANKTVTAVFAEDFEGSNSLFLAGVFSGGALGGNAVSTSGPVDGAGTANFYLAAVTTRNPAAVSTITGLGLTWTRVLRQCSARGATMLDLWMAQGTPASNGAVTAQFPAAFKSAVITVTRYRNAHPSQPLGAPAGLNTRGLNGACSGGSDSAAYNTSITTSVPNALIYTAASMRNRKHAPGAGFTERAETTAGSGGDMASLAVADKPVPAPALAAANGSFSGSTDWSVVAVEIRPAPGGSPPTPTPPTPTSTPTATPTGAPTATPTGAPTPTPTGAPTTPPPPQSYTLTTSVQGSGQINLSPPGGTYNAGTQVSLQAVPAAGWQFAGWQGHLSGSANPALLTMDGNKSVTAVFSQPSGGGVVTHETTASGTALAAASVSSAPISGSGLFLAAVTTRNAAAVSSVDGLGLTWTRLLRQCSARGSLMVDLWVAQGTAAGGPVTASFPAAFKSAAIAVSRFSGANLVQPTGALSGANTLGVNGACSGGTDSAAYAFTLTTGAPDALIYTAAAMRNRTHTPGAGFTEHAEFFAGSGGDVASLAVTSKPVPAPSASPVGGAFSGSVDWAVIAVEIRPGD